MAGNSRDRSLRGGRKARRAAAKHSVPLEASASADGGVSPAVPSGAVPACAPSFPACPVGSPADADPVFGNPSTNQNPGGCDEAGWGYCTEEQLEELLLKNLDFVYREALGRLVSLGYDEEVALRAILCSGHCYGSMDVLSNILHNAIAHLNNPPPSASPAMVQESVSGNMSPAAAMLPLGGGFSDLHHLQEYSLAGMVCLLQQVRPSLTRGDAMWCLLMSDLHVGRASTIEIPALPPSSASGCRAPVPMPTPIAVAAAPGGDFAPSIHLCRLHAAAAAAAAAGGSAADPRQFDLPPSMKSAMRRNGSIYTPATGFRPFLKPSARSALPSPVSEPHQPPKEDNSADNIDRSPTDSSGSADVVDSVLKALEGMSLEDGKEDPKKEMILDVIGQIRDLEIQVKERKEWAQQKALQAARKLSNDLMELRELRMEQEENQRLKKGKQTLEDTNLKRLTEKENALKKVSGQADRTNAVVRRLETENAEIRAEMEAAKLSASESARTTAEVQRREKKLLKKITTWEKQREKIQGDVSEDKKKIAQMQQRIEEGRMAIKANEVKWKQEVKAKEQAIASLEEERRAKEAAKVNSSRRVESLHQKIEIDFQRHKDDVQRLEEELSRLKASAGANQLSFLSVNAFNSVGPDAAKALKEFNERVISGSNKSQECVRKLNKICMICKKDEISVVFLPCAHQVVCANCSEDHEKKGKVICPCCNSRVEERIRVFGASS